MTSFQAKICWKRLRKRENKNYPYVTFPPNGLEKITKKQQKNSEVPLWHHFKPKQVGKGRERVKIKILVPFRSYPTRNKKIQKNSKKILKIRKYRYGFLSSQNRLKKAEKERNKKLSFRSIPFLPDRLENIPKKQLKNSKIKKHHYGISSG